MRAHVEQFTSQGTHVYTDEYDSYNTLDRPRSTVAHGCKQWTRHDDGDGLREVHTNTTEGMWSGLRIFLRPFRGVSKHFLSGYVAIHEFRINPRAARLTCTRAEFADLWQEVMGEPWDESRGAADPAECQRLRDEIDAIVAHLYALSRDDFDHILGTFPLVFPDTNEGRSKRAALLATYDEWAGKL